ncbi:TRAP transporter TatT component family protein [Acidobacteriota bacterium]
MKAKCFCLVLGLVLVSVMASGQTPEELIKKADALYAEMQDLETAEEALALYRDALIEAENKYEAYWKISRILYYVGEHKDKKKDRQNTFAQGVYHAEKAMALEPEKPDGYYWRGVNNGKYGETRGVLKSLALVKPIKSDMNKVIELNRAYEDGGPDRVMGRVFFKLPGIAGGDKDKSLEHLLKSKEYGPEDALTRVYLADTYLAQKEVEKARAELDYVMNLPDDPLWVTAVQQSKELAEELLKDKKFRKK